MLEKLKLIDALLFIVAAIVMDMKFSQAQKMNVQRSCSMRFMDFLLDELKNELPGALFP